ncbi:TSTD2 protein, partial [Polypterus senegalus]
MMGESTGSSLGFEFPERDEEASEMPRGSKVMKASLPPDLRKKYAFVRKKAFAIFVQSRESTPGGQVQPGRVWHCCAQAFLCPVTIHKHVAVRHEADILRSVEEILKALKQPDQVSSQQTPFRPPGEAIEGADVDPSPMDTEQKDSEPGGRVLLFYCYCDLQDPNGVCVWQRGLCQRLQLTGKVRIAKEGINGTVGGSEAATERYMEAMLSHPVFSDVMCKEDFKSSSGGARCFPDLRVGVYSEIVPLGIDPLALSYKVAGAHLSPKEFHEEVERYVSEESGTPSDTILLDCRNFYESRIGRFTKCLAPDIRKFSYFPDYVDQNLDLFRERRVLMYCTGGIRCERASAYLRSKGVCKSVYQLKGGIHKYLEHFPDGFFRGKLFVFDERYAIASNGDVISNCRYCGAPWDQYRVCTSDHCHQLVLSCGECQGRGRTACCATCQEKAWTCANDQLKEECDCTRARPRIPVEGAVATAVPVPLESS